VPLTNVEDIADRVKDMPVPLNREVAQDLDLDCESVCAEPRARMELDEEWMVPSGRRTRAVAH
jgi:hypothetical protein